MSVCQDRDRHTGVLLSARSGPESMALLDDLAVRAGQVGGDAASAVALLPSVGDTVPRPGVGRTADRWAMLASLAAADLTAARVAEAHLDALAIFAEAGTDPARDLTALGAGADSTWGVFAAEGAGVRVDAQEVRSPGAESWTVTGTKPWCSLAGLLTHALITAHTGPGSRRLFAIRLQDPTVEVVHGGWVSRGLQSVESGPIELHGTEAVPIGGDQWYLQRPGFAWGGAGVAACWFGGAVGLARSLWSTLAIREPDQIGEMHLGAVDLALHSARLALACAAADIDQGRADGSEGVVMAGRVRGLVAVAAEEILTRLGHTLGPAPLTQDESHARRVADLQVYLRQHHAERDEAALGRAILTATIPW